MNKLFRNIKENDNLDAIEESDNEEEFEDSREDKYVYLDRSFKMVCEYNNKFKRWVPISLAGEKDRIVKFKLPIKDQAKLVDYPEIIDQEIKCRLVCVDLPNGEKEILCTSLLDTTKYNQEDMSELYHYRWSIEESYKLFKARIEIERFSGKTALAVKQDFFAKIFMMNLCATLAFPIEEKLKQEAKADNSTKHRYKINRTSAYAMTQSIAISLLLKDMQQHAIEAFDNLVNRTTEIVRPGRSFPRKKKPKRPYHNNYKPL
jgi:hypothetical protein